MLQSLIASLAVSILIIAMGVLANWKASKDARKANMRNEMLKEKRVSRWVTMIGITTLFLLPYIVSWLWQPGNSIVFSTAVVSVSTLMVYLTYFIGENGIPPSLSGSFYLGMGYSFTIMCFIVSISTAIGLFELTTGKWYQFFVFLAAIGLGFVGAAPMFKDKGMERTVHITGAILCGVFSQAVVILSGYWILPAVLFPVTILIILKNGNRVFWFEMAAFASTFAVIELMTFK